MLVFCLVARAMPLESHTGRLTRMLRQPSMKTADCGQAILRQGSNASQSAETDEQWSKSNHRPAEYRRKAEEWRLRAKHSEVKESWLERAMARARSGNPFH